MSDNLQEVWQQGGGRADPRALLGLVERQYSVRESVWRRNAADLAVCLFFTPLTAWAAWSGHGALIRSGFALITLAQVIAAIAIVLYHRRERAAPRADLSLRDYARESLAFCDRRIRFLQTSKYWHNAPFLVGLLLFAIGLWRFTGNAVAGLAALAACALAAIGILYGNKRRLVGEIRAKRREIEEYLGS